MTARLRKEGLRSDLRARRAGVPDEQRRAAARRLAEGLPHHPLVRDLAPGQVLVPVGHRSEIDTHLLAKRLERLGWAIVRPRSDVARTHIDAVPWSLERPLVPGHAGILEPPADAPGVDPARLDLILVPGVAFAVGGHRVGSGAGFFDRFLAPLLDRPTRPVTIGIGYRLQRVPQVPNEPHDIALDGLQLEDESVVCRPDVAVRE